VAPRPEERAEARRRAVKEAAPLRIRAPRHLDDGDEPIRPRRGGRGRDAEVAPEVPESLDVGHLVIGVGLREALEPALTHLRTRGRLRADGRELLDPAADAVPDGRPGTVR